MMKQRNPLFLYVILGIAGIGLLSWVIKDPGKLLTTLLLTAIFATVIFFIFRAIFRTRMSSGSNSDEMRKYRRAVKQSQKKYEQQKPKQNRSAKHKGFQRKRQRPTHLTLIKGNKQENKNNNDRASN